MWGAGVLTPQPSGLITGFVGTPFRSIVETILRKPTAIRLATGSLDSLQSGKA
jgi:hypothetical protein